MNSSSLGKKGFISANLLGKAVATPQLWGHHDVLQIVRSSLMNHARRPIMNTRTLPTLLASILITGLAAVPASQAAGPSVPTEIVVGYSNGTGAEAQDAIAANAGTDPGQRVSARSQVVSIGPGESRDAAIRRLRNTPGVRYAVPNLIAHASGLGWMPNDRGRVNRLAGWQVTQWNFMRLRGVNAPDAWANVRAAGRPGGKGVKVAIIDSGIAYMNWGRFRRSPDLTGSNFIYGYDFVARNRYPLDRNGHGTHVAGTIAESTNNGKYMTGLAYGATIIPLRVLDAQGSGDSADIAEAIRFAANRGAAVINLSIEFDPGTTADQIPDVISAIDYATAHGSLVVSAAGNDASDSVTYPAKAASALAVGATTEHRCLTDYSNYGSGLDLVAPGGGSDANIPADANCKPNGTAGRDIVQLGLNRGSAGAASVPYRFFLDAEDGTSMAAPHVSATAALVVASGVLGAHPTPAALRAHLLSTADPTTLHDFYGAGLVDAARATQPIVK